MPLFFLLLVFLSPETYAGEGTAGGRGGGTGVICPGEGAPITLEESEILKLGHDLSLPQNRTGVIVWLKARMQFDADFAARIIEEWASVGAYETWPEVDAHDISKILQEPVAKFSEFLRDTLLNHAVQFELGNLPLIQDDFAAVSPGCKKSQLSLLAPDRPLRIIGPALSPQTRRYLELHETLYRIGMRSFAQKTPGKTRALIRALHSPRTHHWRKAIRDFQAPAKTRFPLHTQLNRILLLTHSFEVEADARANAKCPLALSFIFDGENQQVVALEKADTHSVVSKIYQPVPLGGSHMYHRGGPRPHALFFPISIAPGYATLFFTDPTYRTDGDYTLVMGGDVAITSLYNTYLPGPKKYDGLLGCNYSAWNETMGEGAADVVKAWNQAILPAEKH